MSNGLVISYGHATHQGLKRTDNQDAFGKFPPDSLALSLPKGQLFIVADGMGGHAHGKEASAMAVQIVQQVYFADPNENIPDSLSRAFETANERIYQRATSTIEFRGMGTTCTALVLKDDRAYIAHVGDSRIYRITKSKIEQLTQDHTKVAEMKRLGILTESEAKSHPEKSHLYRALGIAPTVKVDLAADLPLRPGERFLLCTDGLAKIAERELKQIVLANSPPEACDKLIELANARGGSDNSTAQVIWVKNAATPGAGGLSVMRRLFGG
ncbi:MAG: Stp1/IreP family PP2C-type Ser/Thr phosphatase [candidate division KSB1 bacterium]|nr:Stp1/IreP family PP2C-type Ser/Thr phosphatase [candidate division KSB1 bacterium]MDZ7365391.1 Stp1/IreP family PP2C-type Ser/Thr phosphatase [candidate division KSB1 bacterium]MDZ7403562.1 Stp1/IreP family PP2C-type Ser/Thr phosphatase [candidate division KSB1 bacterium]